MKERKSTRDRGKKYREIREREGAREIGERKRETNRHTDIHTERERGGGKGKRERGERETYPITILLYRTTA